MGIIMADNAEIVILSVHVDRYPTNLRPIVVQILMAARLIVPGKWKSELSSNINEVIKKVDEAFKYEQIMTHKEGNAPCFYKQWDPWILLRQIK